MSDLHVVALVGSLRAASRNRRLFDLACELAPPGMRIEEAPIRELPLYDEDLRTSPEESGLPDAAQALRASVRAADAVLLVSPEYNFSIPGVLKNAIDWASRRPDQPFRDKPVAIMGAGGRLGTARMQYHLRQVLLFLDAHPLNMPEVQVQHAEHQLGDGATPDEDVRRLVAEQLAALAAWTRRLQRGVSGR